MPEPVTFPRWMKRLRAALDLTQEMLAEQASCATHTIRTFESGKRRPSRELAERLAHVLQVPPEQRADFVRLARTSVGSEHPVEEVVDRSPPLAEQERAQAPAALPRGTVTLVFTDIEGST